MVKIIKKIISYLLLPILVILVIYLTSTSITQMISKKLFPATLGFIAVILLILGFAYEYNKNKNSKGNHN